MDFVVAEWAAPDHNGVDSRTIHQPKSMTTKEIAEKLVTFCRQGKFEEAQVELYSKDAISIEPKDTPMAPKETRGLAAIIEKGRKFSSAIETTHSMEVSEPLLSESSFACTMRLDATMKGHGRTTISELCLYVVAEGKIVSEQFHP
jgi:hypothetical protein